MTNKKLVSVVALFLILLSVLTITAKGNSLFSSGKKPIRQVKFYEDKTFREGIKNANSNAKPFAYHITGGITPHHLFASSVIADFYLRLSQQKPTTIILIGPNHYERGNFKALTSLDDWETPLGVTEPNETIINSLIQRDLVRVDGDVLQNDHAVTGSIPFIKYYIPEAKIVPILLSGRMTEQDASVLADNLKDFIKKDVVIVAPVDFSHYLTNKQAQEKDSVTLQMIKDFDYRQLFLMNNDYLDSPPSISTVLMVLQKLGTTHMDLLYHSNSGEIQKNDYIPTTSYFSIAFY